MANDDWLYRLLNSGQARHAGIGGGMPNTLPSAITASPAPVAPSGAPSQPMASPVAPQPARSGPPSAPIGRSGTLLNILTGGSSYDQRSAEYQSGLEQKAAGFIQQAVQGGSTPQKAIMDFIQTPDGQDYFTSGGNIAQLANVGKLAAVDPRDEMIAKRQQIHEAMHVDDTDPVSIARFGQALMLAGDHEGSQASIQYANALKKQSPQVVINGPEVESELKKKLADNTAKVYSGYIEAADKAGLVRNSMDQLTALSDAPQGGLQGQLASSFPQFDDKAAAFTSVVNGLAPLLRVQGSGATSDRDIQLILDSLPALANTQEGNARIVYILKQKAAIDRDRGQAVQDFLADIINQSQLHDKLREINNRPIMTDSFRDQLKAYTGKLPINEPVTLPPSAIPDSFAKGKPQAIRERAWQIMHEAQQ